MTPLACRNCGAGLSPDAIGHAADIIVCEHCGSVHQRAPEPATPTTTASSTPAAPRRLAQPERFSVERGQGALKVSWRKGKRSGAVILGLFSLAWLGMALVSGAWPLLIMVPLLGYLALVRGINQLSVHVDAAELVVRQGPLPWPGAMRLASPDIEQLFSVEKVSTTRSGSNGNGQARTRRHYQVRARLKDGQRKRVLPGLSSVDQALWLEREMELTLGLADVPVEGEFRR